MKKLFAFAIPAGAMIASALFIYPGRDLWGSFEVRTVVPVLAILVALILGGLCIWAIARAEPG